MGDQDIISPYNINIISSKKVMRIIKDVNQLGDNKLIQYQILQTSIIRILLQTVGKIILGEKV